ncbi:MAG: hypothetical protein IPH18_04615 [Chitinophagaceae bacterium]|nr:hypothetical protein [Chitinophagaceae bacterium]
MAQAQTGWTISYQKKALLKNAAEDKTRNVVSIKKSTLKSTALLQLNPVGADTAYNITIEAEAVGEAFTGLNAWEYSGKAVSISGTELKTLFTGRKKLAFYYTAIPKDPNLAAVVRVRKVHICTVNLK